MKHFVIFINQKLKLWRFLNKSTISHLTNTSSFAKSIKIYLNRTTYDQLIISIL